MKSKIAITLFVLITSFVYTTQAQSLQKLVPENSKVYVLFPGNHVVKDALANLKHWGYWQIVDDHKDADFVVKIVAQKTGGLMSSTYSAYAEISDKTNFPIFTTQSVTFYSKDEAIVKLVHKRIIDGKN